MWAAVASRDPTLTHPRSIGLVSRVGKQSVNAPSFTVRTDSEKHIDFSLNSPLGGGRPGRVKRRSLARKAGGGGDDEEEE